MNTTMNSQNVRLLSTRSITAIALLSAVATVLMLFEFPLWFAPSFYKVDLSELPVMVGAFALGPMAGVVIELIKILINLLINGTDTAGIGELANFIFGCALVVPSAIIYSKYKTMKSAVIGMSVGTIVFIIAGCLLNAYVLLPTYAKVYGMPLNALVAMGTAVNPKIDSLMTFVLLAVAPFNLIKGVAVSAVTAMLYKGISPIIRGYQINK